MTNKNSQNRKTANQIAFSSETHPDLFETLCSDSASKDACQRYVDRLEEASRNISRERST